MTRVTSFVIRGGDCTQELDFKILDEDGAVYPIPEAATIVFECRLDGASVLFFADDDYVTVVEAAAGHVRYTVQSGDFDSADAGTYFCRMLVNHITTDEVGLTVLADQVVAE